MRVVPDNLPVRVAGRASRSLRPWSTCRALRPRIAVQRKECHGDSGDQLPRCQRGVADPYLQVARAAVNGTRAEIEFDLEQSGLDRPAGPTHCRPDLGASHQLIEQAEFEIGTTGKRLATILELTLIGHWPGLRGHGHDQGRPEPRPDEREHCTSLVPPQG